MEKVILFLEKLGTFLGDRRLWALAAMGGLVTLLGFFGLDEMRSQALTVAFGGAYDATTVLVAALVAWLSAMGQLVAIVVSFGMLIWSWTKRVPSGLGFKTLEGIGEGLPNNLALPRTAPAGGYSRPPTQMPRGGLSDREG